MLRMETEPSVTQARRSSRLSLTRLAIFILVAMGVVVTSVFVVIASDPVRRIRSEFDSGKRDLLESLEELYTSPDDSSLEPLRAGVRHYVGTEKGTTQLAGLTIDAACSLLAASRFDGKVDLGRIEEWLFFIMIDEFCIDLDYDSGGATGWNNLSDPYSSTAAGAAQAAKAAGEQLLAIAPFLLDAGRETIAVPGHPALRARISPLSTLMRDYDRALTLSDSDSRSGVAIGVFGLSPTNLDTLSTRHRRLVDESPSIIVWKPHDHDDDGS